MEFLKKIGLKKSLYGGFGLVLFILIGIGLVAYLNFLKVSSNLAEVNSEMAHLNTKIDKVGEDSKVMVQDTSEVQKFVEQKLIVDMKNRSVDLKILERSVASMVSEFEEVLKVLEEMSMDDQLDSDTQGVLEDLVFDVEDVVDAAKKERLPAVRKIVQQLLSSVEKAKEVGVRVNAIQKTVVSFEEQTEDMMVSSKRVNGISVESKNGADQIRQTILYSVIVSVLVAGVLALLVVSGVVKGVMVMAAEFRQAADDVASSSRQVSDSSQQLSHGATEQASSLEETSSSLDQLNAMTKQNADNAAKANQLAIESTSSSEQGDQAMKEMQQAMQGIGESSNKISKIIKTIEEIAFQTNLLALNAAVEAARAGEHGKGFAVVADEVRNLAQRSAVAAKDTAALIEESITCSKEGEVIANKAGTSLGCIMENSKKVTNVIAEIAAASKEQSEGINQIANAVGQMDTVTQQNAATSEETSAAAQALNNQSGTLREIIGELEQLVEGRANLVGMRGNIPLIKSEEDQSVIEVSARKNLPFS